jgi:dienelactone hydrolase
MYSFAAILFFITVQGIPSISYTIFIEDWQYAGPFSIGAREGIIGVEPYIDDWSFSPMPGRTYPSILVPGGKVGWKSISSTEGAVDIKYDEVEWDTLQDIYGIAGLSCASYAYGEFKNDGVARGLVSAKGASSFTLNGMSYPGDAYKDGYAMIPIILKDGKNRVVMKLSGYAGHSFSFKIMPVPDDIMIVTKDLTLPDLFRNERYDGFIGVPVVNTIEKRLKNIILEISGENFETTSRTIMSLMPQCAIKVPVPLKSTALVGQNDSLLFTITATCGEIKTSVTEWIKIKDKNEVHARTFISNIDNSCQYYAVQPPSDFSAESTYALIMTCHGAGVEARGQAAAYLQKDWAYVVAPTNRRKFGFDWQDWGRLDFLEVFEQAKKNFKVDEDRVYLTGHSMGGHGVWHIGLSHPDLFAAIAPSAGWSSFQLYVPWFLQKSEIFCEPEILKYRDIVLREDNPLAFVENASNLPIYILHGGADDNVPPIQARMFAEELTKKGIDFTYNEVPGMGHWWNNDSTPGTDCVDLEEMMEFLKTKKRDPYPSKITFKTSDIAYSNQAYWVRIDELENPYADASIKIVAPGTLKPSYLCLIYTMNVKKFTLNWGDRPLKKQTDLFIINEAPHLFDRLPDEGEVSFIGQGRSFKVDRSKNKSVGKRIELYGPIKQAYFSPFLLIYGTIGDTIFTNFNLNQARLQAYAWWIRANGFVEVLPDTEVTSEHIKNYNLILFGSDQTNSIIAKVNGKLPIRFNENYVPGRYQSGLKDLYWLTLFIGKKIQKETDLCLIEIYPNPLNPEKFVLLYSATTQKAMKYMNLFSTLYSGAGLPDFIVWDESAAQYGWGGVVATGFFDKNWKLDEKLMYVKE